MTDAQKRLDKLYAQCAAHFGSLYAPEKKLLVFGDGSPSARLMLVGEAPGEQEALKGKPFVGKAGKLLDDFLEGSGIRREDLFISNVVKLRPTATSKAGRTVNRAPTKEEIALFLPWLVKEIEILSPKLIITLGNVPFRALSGLSTATIGVWHGKLMQDAPSGVPLFALYHPAAVIYQKTLAEVFQSDLQTLRAYLLQHLLIAKQDIK